MYSITKQTKVLTSLQVFLLKLVKASTWLYLLKQ